MSIDTNSMLYRISFQGVLTLSEKEIWSSIIIRFKYIFGLSSFFLSLPQLLSNLMFFFSFFCFVAGFDFEQTS